MFSFILRGRGSSNCCKNELNPLKVQEKKSNYIRVNIMKAAKETVVQEKGERTECFCSVLT